MMAAPFPRPGLHRGRLRHRLVGAGRRLLTGIVFASGVGLAGADAGMAQDLGGVRLDRAGTRVRVHATAVSPQAIEGQVQRLREDSILVVRLDGGQEVEISRSRIDRLEFSTGRRGHPWWGAVIGTAVMGIPSAIYWSRECEGGASCDQAGVKGFFIGGAIYGALPGLLVGSLIRTRDWRAMPLVYLETAVVRRVPTPGVGPAAGGRFPSAPGRLRPAGLPAISLGVRIPVGGNR